MLGIESNETVPKLYNPRFLLAEFCTIVGARHVLTRDSATGPYRTGYRSGEGECLAVIRPGTLLEMWQVLQACVAADVAVIMQAANTGLTGGSTPDGDDYGRALVIISTRRLSGIRPIEDATQVICLPGATLAELEDTLKPLGREPHSVLGSSCIGASVLGGVCNNSGGALVQRGPAYTEMALYARLGADGSLELVNHLGIDLGGDPEEILTRLQHFSFSLGDVEPAGQRRASDTDYAGRIRDLDASTPARYNADTSCLFEASGSAGKIAVFAVRLDTFATEKNAAVFYVGTNAAETLQQIRLRLLRDAPTLPVVGEYIHRDAFAIAARYGKDMYLAIRVFGTRRIPRLLQLESGIAALARRLGLDGAALLARALVRLAGLLPQHLPPRLADFGERYEHHLLLKVTGAGVAFTRDLLAELLDGPGDGYFECDPAEAEAAFLHRFVVAGAAKRYGEFHAGKTGELLALDIALPRNTREWFERLPAGLDAQIALKIYYGHFLCHVFHQDYVIRSGSSAPEVKRRLLELLDARGAEYPAEHNVGHLYEAKPPLREFYRALDPCNQFNPGIGLTSKQKHWK